MSPIPVPGPRLPPQATTAFANFLSCEVVLWSVFSLLLLLVPPPPATVSGLGVYLTLCKLFSRITLFSHGEDDRYPILQMRKQLVSDKVGTGSQAACLYCSPLPSNTELLEGVCVCVCACVCVCGRGDVLIHLCPRQGLVHGGTGHINRRTSGTHSLIKHSLRSPTWQPYAG